MGMKFSRGIMGLSLVVGICLVGQTMAVTSNTSASSSTSTIAPTSTLSPAVQSKIDVFFVKVNALRSKYPSDADWITFLDKLQSKISGLKPKYTGNSLISAVLNKLSDGVTHIKTQASLIGLDPNEQILPLPFCGKIPVITQVMCIQAPCPQPSNLRTYTNYDDWKKDGAQYLYAGACKSEVSELQFVGMKDSYTAGEKINITVKNTGTKDYSFWPKCGREYEIIKTDGKRVQLDDPMINISCLPVFAPSIIKPGETKDLGSWDQKEYRQMENNCGPNCGSIEYRAYQV